MKIAVVIPWFFPNRGGAENGAYELSRHLVSRGHEVHVITPRYRTKWPKYEVLDGIYVHRFFTRGIPFSRKFSELAHSIWPFFSIPRLIRSINPDIVHLHYFLFTGHAAYRAAKRMSISTLLTLVGNDVYDPFHVPGDFLHGFNSRVVNGVDHVVAACEFIGDVVSKKFSLGRDKLSVVPYGVDTNRFKPAPMNSTLRKSFGIPNEGIVVLTVQRLHERKEVDYFLQAAKEVISVRSDCYFLIVGKGPEMEHLKKIVIELGISGNVRFLGFVVDEQLPSIYQLADLFAFHTSHEGFGIVLLEAMASAKAVVTARAGGTIDIVEEGKTGTFVPPRDSKALAKAILGLLVKPVQMKRMGEFGRERVLMKYSWVKITDAYEKIYNTLLNKTKEAVR